jgi:hypothetical protein
MTTSCAWQPATARCPPAPPPTGSPCRTGRGRVAAQYHTARFRLVPHLARAFSVPVPPLRRPARPGPSCAALRRPARGRPGTCGSGTPAPPPSKAGGIGPGFLAGELHGSHDPSGIVFTVLAALSGMEREYIRDRINHDQITHSDQPVTNSGLVAPTYIGTASGVNTPVLSPLTPLAVPLLVNPLHGRLPSMEELSIPVDEEF